MQIYPHLNYPFVIVRITERGLKIQSELSNVFNNYRENAYYIGSKEEYLAFSREYKINFVLLECDEEQYIAYIDSCDAFYFDETEAYSDVVGDLKNNSKFYLMVNEKKHSQF